MAIRTPPLFLGKAGIQHPAANDRLGLLGAVARPGVGLASIGGSLIGPDGMMGELTLVSPTSLRISPARWLVPGMQSTLQGTYEVINDADLSLVITARHASSYRRALVVVYVAASSVAGGGADTAGVLIVNGALSATSPGPLPTATELTAAGATNYVAIGEIAIPPTSVGTAVTMTPYNPRTGLRGGILPVQLGDTVTTPGYAGAPGQYLGEYRDHPDRGLERWYGAAIGWRAPWGGPWGQLAGVADIARAGVIANYQAFANLTLGTLPRNRRIRRRARFTLNMAGSTAVSFRARLEVYQGGVSVNAGNAWDYRIGGSFGDLAHVVIDEEFVTSALGAHTMTLWLQTVPGDPPALTQPVGYATVYAEDVGPAGAF